MVVEDVKGVPTGRVNKPAVESGFGGAAVLALCRIDIGKHAVVKALIIGPCGWHANCPTGCNQENGKCQRDPDGCAAACPMRTQVI
ncbi:hypothetical protein I553_4872 [Mycobacterium xenopi 4042]|uniref:Uncharacterized protein n=1 Tax=Mycobacterium xenopi 4042 TaxID=1299334 RepID=X8AIB4_MYCXE|nr:hypothetical protein I553_4872 [Mycobacterium xenopi 4042]